MFVHWVLVLSGSPIDNTRRTDVDTDFGEVVLGDSPDWSSKSDSIKTVNIVNKIKPVT